MQPTNWRCSQLRDSVLGPSPPWGTFTDAFAGAKLIGATHSAGDVTTVLQGTAPRLRATDSATHSGVITQDQDALEVTSGDMKRRRVDAGELSAASDLLEAAAWEFGDGVTTTLTHEQITIDTDVDGGVHMVALVGSVTSTEERPGAPAVFHTVTESADIYLPRPDSPRGPHDWEEAMLGEALTAYPVRIVHSLRCCSDTSDAIPPHLCSLCTRRRSELRAACPWRSLSNIAARTVKETQLAR